MNSRNKAFKIRGDQIRRLIPNMGGCIASNRITVDGAPVGYMYREQPIDDVDSGWRFFAGDESQEYIDAPENIAIYEVNTLCNYDPAIVPFLDVPIGAAFGRVLGTDTFEAEALRDGDNSQASKEKKWPPPGFPIVEGDYVLTETWSIQLPEKFARRVEDGSLVLWRPGFTIWLAAWGSEKGMSQAKRLKSLKSNASVSAHPSQS